MKLRCFALRWPGIFTLVALITLQEENFIQTETKKQYVHYNKEENQ